MPRARLPRRLDKHAPPKPASGHIFQVGTINQFHKKFLRSLFSTYYIHLFSFVNEGPNLNLEDTSAWKVVTPAEITADLEWVDVEEHVWKKKINDYNCGTLSLAKSILPEVSK